MVTIYKGSPSGPSSILEYQTFFRHTNSRITLLEFLNIM